MAVNKSSLSAGEIIRAILLEDADVAARTNKVFPIVTDNAELPYITYRRSEMAVNPQKSGQPGTDEVMMDILCFTSRYTEGVELAEAVRGALDFKSAEHNGSVMRGCYLAESEELYENDAYIQRLSFKLKI